VASRRSNTCRLVLRGPNGRNESAQYVAPRFDRDRIGILQLEAERPSIRVCAIDPGECTQTASLRGLVSAIVALTHPLSGTPIDTGCGDMSTAKPECWVEDRRLVEVSQTCRVTVVNLLRGGTQPAVRPPSPRLHSASTSL
jgi:hypothetical protein